MGLCAESLPGAPATHNAEIARAADPGPVFALVGAGLRGGDQRECAGPGVLLLAEDMPGSDFRVLLDTFNDRWVPVAGFFSTAVLVELLRLTGEWTASYYENVDPSAPCEPVGFFGSTGETSPFWQAIAREYMERWVHHSQIRR